MKNNYFVSLNVPIDIGEKIYSQLDKIKIEKFCKGKFIPLGNLHLTLRFFGELPKEEIVLIREKLREVNFNKFDLDVGKFGFFRKGIGGILWIDLISSELFGIIEKIWGKVGGEKRKFKSHLTLMRVKRVFDIKGLFDYLNKIKFEDLKFNVDKFFLMKSYLLPEGSQYEIIEEFISN